MEALTGQRGTAILMPAGRPTEYTSDLCEKVESLMRQGYSKTAAAGAIGVCRQTILNWQEQHPEFLGAVKRGEAARTHKLETDLLQAPDGPNVTSRIFALKNAAPEEWKDKQSVEHGGADGGPLVIQWRNATD
ncbi:MAG: hypothetical protein HC889_16950 [Synechococcaceae cyanobacterium SM1_2_3]|nr:hypothetical protein [Synechococcaceae cyanobacterium SM1_2_3]